MTEEERQYRQQMQELSTQKIDEFKTMVFTYKKALSYFPALKDELDDVLVHIEDLKVKTLGEHYKPILDQANELFSKMEMLDNEVQNDSEMQNFILAITSHNITVLIPEFDDLSNSIKHRIDKIREEKKLRNEAIMREKKAFADASKMNTQASFENYLKSYPIGLYVVEAKAKIDKFIKIEKDHEAYFKANDINTIESYEFYLEQFPTGIYYKEMQNKINILKKEKQQADEVKRRAYVEAMLKNKEQEKRKNTIIITSIVISVITMSIVLWYFIFARYILLSVICVLSITLLTRKIIYMILSSVIAIGFLWYLWNDSSLINEKAITSYIKEQPKEDIKNLYKNGFLWYRGQVTSNNIPQGKGIYYFKNGDEYEGEFVNGRMEGLGTYKSSNGAKYSGEFKDNRHNGNGILYWSNGKKHYEGQWKLGKRNGLGKEYDINGVLLFEREWKDGN